ncbi:imm11 family protein [Enterobacter cloacae]|uniref:imm11 family protein n=1 Tax=Enterobacter cloacae TaxID=550 RepID=UPI003DA12759
MYELRIASDYPNSYWFEYQHPDISGSAFSQCKSIETYEGHFFTLKSKVSEKVLLAYDLYFSDGPVFISPRLTSLISCHDVFRTDVQLIDATVSLNETQLQGYKIINILREVSCIDMEASESQPILSYLPNGPRKFSKIVYKEKIIEDFSMARCSEYKSCIIISNEFKEFLSKNDVKGIDFADPIY